ncbi:MAG TPA: helix-turn-helix transcriptional regulator [Actinomycetota bacterium]|jgi:transcriptional regulator with XRE-family HTH domain
MAAARHGPTVRRRQLGAELRRLREESSLTIERVAKRLECSESKVSRIENGQVGATPRDVRDMLDLYEVDPLRREALIEIARETRQKGWWHAYRDVPVVPASIGLEESATALRMYAALLVPGLLQTREYASAVLRALQPDLDAEQFQRWVDLRIRRQSLLYRAGAPALWALLDEAVLRRPVGGPDVMAGQLRRLAEAAEGPNVTLQVVPFTAGEHAGMDGGFTIFAFSRSADADVVHLDISSGDLYLEKPEQIRRYNQVFDQLRAAALEPEASLALLVELAGGS